jgi:hypothetical protein
LQGHGGSIRTRLNMGAWHRSRSLLPASSRHAHSCHRAPLGPTAIYLFNVKTFVFVFLLSLILLINKGGVGLFLYIDWCSLTTPYSTWGYILFFPQGLSRIYIHLIHY